MKEIEEISKLVSNEKILNIIYLLSSLENDIKWSTQKTIMFQTGIIRACLDIKNDGLDELKERITKLENQIESGNIKVNNTKNSNKNVNAKQVPKEETTFYAEELGDVILSDNDLESAIPKEINLKKEEKNDIDTTNINWQNILNKLKTSGKIMLFTSLANTNIKQIGDMIIEVEFPNGLTPFVQKILDDSTNKKDLSKIIFQETGKEWQIKYKDLKSSSTTKVETKKDEDLGIDINIIE